MARRLWVFDPDSGGVKIPEKVKQRTTARIERYAAEHLTGRYTRLDIRYRGQFCYIDAFTEPEPPGEGWPPPDWPETREEFLARLRETPTHLCRLRFFGNEDGWSFAFYTYSNERYELCIFPSGGFFGPPEEAFQTASVYPR